MLSIENPPSDPHLKLTADDDDDVDRIHTSSASQIEVVVDLFKSVSSDFEDNHNQDSSNPPPKFSIRDYVCSTRSKDIATNWPFSEKNLQLCQKQGVKDLLPPFQSLDAVREQSVKGCVVNHNLPDQENLSNSDRKTVRQSHQHDSVFANGASCNQKLNLDRLHIISTVSDHGDGEIPSEVKQSHSTKDSGAAILLDSSTKQVKGAILPEIRETGIIIQQEPPLKKSKAILKLGTSAGTSTKEDSTTNSFIISEIMAYKVCPICKTFSSTSNTTLNAHIDQCLSGESTLKWSADPKVIKHRIKPRKMRTMVDIYATAKHCTLEDLDKRNGTNWAMSPNPVDQSGELCLKERAERMPASDIKENGDKEGEVYIDTNGTKVRILSKHSEGDTVIGNSRAQKGDKGSISLVEKKKKKPYNVLKHQKFLKLTPHLKPCSSKPRHPTFETPVGSSRNIDVDRPSEKEVHLGECSNAQEPIKLDDSGIIRQWVGSKRSGPAKTPRQDNHQHSGHHLKHLVGEKDHTYLADSLGGSNCILNRQQSFKDTISSQSSKRMETSSDEHGTDFCRGQPPLKRQREELPYLSSKGVGLGKRSVISPKHKKLRKEGTIMRDSGNSSLNRASPGSSSLSNKAVKINTSDSLVFAAKSSCMHQTLSSKATKFTSARKRHFFTNEGTVRGSGSKFKIQSSAPTRSKVNRKFETDSDFTRKLSHSNDDHADITDKQFNLSNFTAKMSHRQTRVLRKRRNSDAMKVFSKEDSPDSLKNSPPEPPCYDRGEGETKEFSPVDFSQSLDNSEDSVDGEESESEDPLAFSKHIATGKAFKEGFGGSLKSSSNSLDPEFHEFPTSSRASKSERHLEVNQRHSCGHPISPTDPVVGGRPEFFSADRGGHVMIGDNSHMETQLDTKDEQLNYFSEVDPIPIPGPPGSFLPSPRHMGSDDLQGKSSLSTCKIQFTEDHHDHGRRAESDSPTSAISDISNPTLEISQSKSSKSFFDEPLAIQDETRKGCSGAAQLSQALNVGAELSNVHTLRINVNFPEKTPVSLNSEQSCCCSRKEGVEGVPVNFQESQLLRRRTISSLPSPEKHMENDCSERFSNINSRSETFSLSNYPNVGPGTILNHPSRILAPEHIEKKFSAEHEYEFSSQKDHDSASPSASTPVLRLMGKNLMVVNRDTDAFLQHRQNHSDLMNPQPHLQTSTVARLASGGVDSKDYQSYHQLYAQGPVNFSRDRRQDAIGGKFNVKYPYMCGSDPDAKAPPTHIQSSGLTPSINAADARKSPVEQYVYNGGSCLLSEEQRSRERPDNSMTNGLEKKIRTPEAKSWGVGSTSSREIIIIDDATDIKADSAIGMMCNEEMRRTRVSLSGNSFPGAPHLSPRYASPFCSNMVEGAGSIYGRRPVVHNTSFQLPISDGNATRPLKWNGNPEGSSLLNPSTATSSSPSQPRPTFYYYPSYA
ncbi:hypothetical protein ACET3Z_015754 [Daucus carota]